MAAKKMKSKMLKSKRSQLTIIIILALIIVVVLVLIFGLIQQNKVAGAINFNEQPQAYVENVLEMRLRKTRELYWLQMVIQILRIII